MAIVKDWVAMAANQIDREVNLGATEDRITAIIRQYCPFKQDIAYQPVNPKNTDLKLLDEVLCDFRQTLGVPWADLEKQTSAIHAAMQRLYEAWTSGEMPIITLGLANHFRQK